MMRLSMTTPRLFCSHTISQKCPHVFGKGPCKHTRYTLYNMQSASDSVCRFGQNGCQGSLSCGQSPRPTTQHVVKDHLCTSVQAASWSGLVALLGSLPKSQQVQDKAPTWVRGGMGQGPHCDLVVADSVLTLGKSFHLSMPASL